MLVKDFITKELPVLKSFDTIEYALALMDDYKLKHLPLVNSEHIYLSLLSEKELMTRPDLSVAIGEPIPVFAPSVGTSSPLHEVLALITRYQLSLLPVTDQEGHCLGVVTRDKLVDQLSDMCQAEAAGSIVVLEMMPQDYSLSEIARLIESNHAHVLSLLSQVDSLTGRLLLAIKIDLEDASPVIRSFERFNYTVRYHFMKKGMVDEILQQRMDELLYYMNM